MSLTISSGWTQSTGCLGTSDFWGWADPTTTDYRDVLGGPAETSTCYPSGYAATSGLWMYAEGCPDGFTEACVGTTGTTTLSTCCPSRAYSFSCGTDDSLGSFTFPCQSRFTASTTITYSLTSFGDDAATLASWTLTETSGSTTKKVVTSGGYATTETRNSRHVMHAMGLAVSVASTTSSTSSPSSTTTDSSTTSTIASSTPTSIASKSSGLSAGTAAGIGIAAAVAVMVLAIGSWLLYRHGVKKGQNALLSKNDNMKPETGAPFLGSSVEMPVDGEQSAPTSHEMAAYGGQSPAPVYELASPQRYELDVGKR